MILACIGLFHYIVPSAGTCTIINFIHFLPAQSFFKMALYDMSTSPLIVVTLANLVRVFSIQAPRSFINMLNTLGPGLDP